MPGRPRDDLNDQLSRAAGLPLELAEMVIDTAAGYVKSKRPDLAQSIDGLLSSRTGSSRLVTLVARIGRRLRP